MTDTTPIILSPEETRELLALEVNYAQLVPDKDEELLNAIIEEYRLSSTEADRFLHKSLLTRDDIWELQLLKRQSQRNDVAVQILLKLRGLEAKLGADLLRTLVEAISRTVLV